MRTVKFVLGALVLLLGCTVVFWPGILVSPGLGEEALASQDADAALETSLGDFLGVVDTSDGDIADSGSRAAAPSAVDPADLAQTTGAAEYETVFPDDEIQRIDLVISKTDWQAMLEEASSSGMGMRMPVEGGEFAGLPVGAAPEGGAMAERMNRLFVEACAGCAEGDEVSVTLPTGDVTGTCVRAGEDLVLQPDAGLGGMRPGGMQPPDGMEPPDFTSPEGAVPPEDGGFARPAGEGFGAAGRGMMVEETADASLTYVECTVRFEGESWEHVGVRYKGNSTLRSSVGSESWKYPLHLDFDEFEETYPETTDQRFFGFDDLSLSNGATDTSLLRDVLPGEIFRAFDVPTPEMAYIQVYLDIGDGPTFLGVYTVVETPDDPFLETEFGSSDGNLYKPQGNGATWTVFDEASFEKKSNQEEEDWRDIEEAFEALHAARDDATAWREGLEAVFDVDGFLRWLAMNRLLGNWDAYGQMAQNYYLYSDPSDGLIHWIPWDLNQSLNARMQMGATPIDPRSVGDQWPLINYLLQDPVYFDVYTAYVADALATVYDADALGELISELQEMLIPALVDDAGELSEHSFLSSVEQMERAGGEVLMEIEARIAEAEAFLEDQAYEPAAVVISEIHYNPSPDQGRDEAYEFIELVNRGDGTIDLSGYCFDDGIDYTFPEGTELDPGECLVVAKDAAQYATAPCQVLQWDRGSLSNGGEVLRLVDAEGDWIDRVAYGDDPPWPEECDGEGSSLCLVDPDSANHLTDSWSASVDFGGNPGEVAGVD